MSADARPLPPASRFLQVLRGLALVALAGYALFLWNYTSVQPGGSDSSGYFNLARLLTEGRVHAPIRTIEGLPRTDLPNYAYSPLGFSPMGDGSILTPTYPPGLPLVFVVFSTLFGWTTGPNVAFVLHTLAGVVLIYLLARQAGLGEPGALCAGLALALAPLYLQHAVNAMSDMPATVWCLLALWLAGRPGWRSAAGAGAAFAMAVLIRPTNALLLVPVGILLGLDWRRWLALGLAGLPAAIGFLLFNHAAYGNPFASGYGEIGALFSREWFPLSLRHYGQWLPMAAGPFVVLALGLPWASRTRFALAHGLWVVGLLAFYAFYYHTHEAWWYLRFVLPAVPSLIVGALLVAERLSTRWPRPAVAALWVALAAIIFFNGRYWDQKFAIRYAGQGERVYAEAVAMARADVPANAIIVAMQASGTLFFSLPQPVIRWDALDTGWPKLLATAARTNRPVYAILWDFETEDPNFPRNVPGRWTPLQRHKFVTLYRFDGPATP